MMKRFLLDIFELLNSIVMSIPIHVIRKLWMKILMQKIGCSNCFLRHIRMHTPWRIRIGSDCVINEHVMLDGRKGLELSDSVDIGEYVTIWTLQHSVDFNHGVCGGKVIIQDHVWIAPRSIILPGVTIGEGSVVATGSIVTKNVPPMTLVAGVPAKPIRILKHSSNWKNNYQVFL